MQTYDVRVSVCFTQGAPGATGSTGLPGDPVSSYAHMIDLMRPCTRDPSYSILQYVNEIHLSIFVAVTQGGKGASWCAWSGRCSRNTREWKTLLSL